MEPSTTYVVSVKSYTNFSGKFSESSKEMEFTTGKCHLLSFVLNRYNTQAIENPRHPIMYYNIIMNTRMLANMCDILLASSRGTDVVVWASLAKTTLVQIYS